MIKLPRRWGCYRNHLLIGAAAVALAMPAYAEDAKWQPYIELGGKLGTERHLGTGEIFIPLWQDPTSLFFGDIRGRFDDEGSLEGNFGLGYRTMVNPEWIVGGYGFFDIAESENDNTFTQLTFGGEALSEDWDFRVNGYIPLSGEKDAPGLSEVRITGTQIQLHLGQERALYGVDAEVGYKLFGTADGDTELRGYVGGYYFDASGYETVAGPRGRLEARLFDLGVLGPQSRVTIGGEVQWDDPRGTQAFAALRLRVPLQIFGDGGNQALTGPDRRMVERIQRDVDIVIGEGTGGPEDVYWEGGRFATGTIVFADKTANNGTGDLGTYDNPNTLDDTGDNGGTNAFEQAASLASSRGELGNGIVAAIGNEGTIGTNGAALYDHQALVGGNSIVRLTGAESGVTVNWLVPGTRPSVQHLDKSGPIVTMGEHSRVSGLDIFGFKYVDKVDFGDDTEDGIFAKNRDRLWIEDNGIFGVGNDGIHLKHNPQIVDGLWMIKENTILYAYDEGIDLYIDLTSSDGPSIHNIQILNNVVGYNGGNGLDFDLDIKGTNLDLTLVLHGNDFYENDSDGADIEVDVYDGGQLLLTGQITDNRFNYNNDAGLRLELEARDGSTITHEMTIAFNEANYNGGIFTGIHVEAYAYGEGTSINQTLVIAYNALDGNSGYGIFVGAKADDGAHLMRDLSIVGNTVYDTYGTAGIGVFAKAKDGGTLGQTVLIHDNLVDGVYNSFSFASFPAGIGVFSKVGEGGSFTQDLTITDNTVRYVYGSSIGTMFAGIGVYTAAFDPNDAEIDQTIWIGNNLLSDISGSAVDMAAGIGVYTRARAGDDVDINQTIGIVGNTLNEIDLKAFGTAAGVGVFTFAEGEDIDINQHLDLSENTINDIVTKSELFGAGVGALTLADANDGDAHVTQTLRLDGNIITEAYIDPKFGFGVGALTYVRASDDVTIAQQGSLSGNSLTDVAINGTSGTGDIAMGVGLATFGEGEDVDISQQFALDGNSIANDFAAFGEGFYGFHGNRMAAGVGVFTKADGFDDSDINQTLSLSGNQLANIFAKAGEGVAVGVGVYSRVFSATDTARIVEDLTLDGNLLAKTFLPGKLGAAGVGSFSSAFGEGAEVTQLSSSMSGNQLDKTLAFSGGARGGTAAFGVGAAVSAFAFSDDAIIDQDLTLDGNSIDKGLFFGSYMAAGIGVFATAESLGDDTRITQDLSLSGNSLTDVSAIAIGGLSKPLSFDEFSPLTVDVPGDLAGSAGGMAAGVGVFTLAGGQEITLIQEQTLDNNIVQAGYTSGEGLDKNLFIGGAMAAGVGSLTQVQSFGEGVFLKGGERSVDIAQSLSLSGNSVSYALAFSFGEGSTAAGVGAAIQIGALTAEGEHDIRIVQNAILDGNSLDHLFILGGKGLDKSGVAVGVGTSLLVAPDQGSYGSHTELDIRQTQSLSGNSLQKVSVYGEIFAAGVGSVTALDADYVDSFDIDLTQFLTLNDNTLEQVSGSSGYVAAGVGSYVSIDVGYGATGDIDFDQVLTADGNSLTDVALGSSFGITSGDPSPAQLNGGGVVMGIGSAINVAGGEGDLDIDVRAGFAGNNIDGLTAQGASAAAGIGVLLDSYVTPFAKDHDIDLTVTMADNIVSGLTAYGSYLTMGIGVATQVNRADFDQTVDITGNSVSNVHLDLYGGGEAGVFGIGVLNDLFKVDFTQSATIADNTVANTSSYFYAYGGSAYTLTAGIGVLTDLFLSEADQTIAIDGNSVTGTQSDAYTYLGGSNYGATFGIVVASFGEGSNFDQRIEITNNIANGTTTSGDFYLYGGAGATAGIALLTDTEGDFGVGDALDQYALIQGNVTNGAVGPSGGDYVFGILIVTDVFNSDGSQTLRLIDNTATGNGGSGYLGEFGYSAGIAVWSYADDASLSQNIQLTGNNASGNAVNGIYVFNEVDSGALIDQTLALRNNVANNNGSVGILIVNFVDGGGTIEHDVSMLGDVASGNDYGIVLANYDPVVNTIEQDATLTNVRAQNNSGIGLFLYNYGAGATQDVTLLGLEPDGGNIFTGNGVADVFAYNIDGTQELDITGKNTYDAGYYYNDGGSQTIDDDGNMVNGVPSGF